ncbi:YceI family protein [Paludibacterium sp. B53371]|uniref:YceI family protein n=1 Tax=Paludibacterium sp. B53371 TaxID=2806263 RepID=UPI00207B6B97|nr:YceI family protein [Paludibacterium sp. B53371]
MKPLLLASLLAAASSLPLAAPVSYTVDSSHTYAAYEINHMGFSNQSGTFTKVAGKVVLDAAAHSGAVDVTIDTNSLQTFWPARDKHLKSEAFFNVAKFPTMSYKADKLVFVGDKLSRVDGNLTLLGVTKPVSLTVTNFHGGKDMAGKDAYGANAVAQIKRSDFGMMTYLPAIADDVTLHLTIEAQAQ